MQKNIEGSPASVDSSGTGQSAQQSRAVTGPSPKAEETKVSTTSRIWAAVSYLWFFCFIPLILKKNNPFVVFHARQGVLLFVVWLFLLVISAVPVLGHIIGLLGNVVVLVLAIMGIIHALGGECWTMPWVGGVAADLEIGK